MASTVAIVGRPNVGKSTLFNRLVGGRGAIVHDRPGVTRDRNFARAEWNGRHFWLVDTGGWIAGSTDEIDRAIRQQVRIAIEGADLVVLVVDTREGVHPADEEVAELLRPIADRVIVVANKADDLANETGFYAFHALGLGDPVPVSAASGKGSGDVLDAIASRLPEEPPAPADESIRVAVVGRPNVGKSSIVNRLLGEERLIVSSVAGTTRDAIDTLLTYEGRTIVFVDTAGLRKRSRVDDDIEFYSRLRTERAVEQADVCVVVIDAKDGVHAQDLKVAESAWEAGKGLIVVVNKWDLVEEKDSNTAYRGQASLVERVPFLEGVPFLYVSALTGLRVRKLLDLIVAVAAERGRRVATAEVNRAIQELVARAQPPQTQGLPVNVLYGSQIGVNPPTFAIVASHPEGIPESYVRYLVRGFRERWGFAGTPLRLRFRSRRRRS